MNMEKCLNKVYLSIVVGWLMESNRVVSVDYEVGGIDIVAFKHHLEDLWLMHGTLLHELNNLILLSNCVIDVVVELGLHLVFELSSLCQEVLVLCWDGKVFSILSEKVELTDMSPRVVSVSHWVHGPDPDVLSTSEEIHFMNFLIKGFPIHAHWDPSEGVDGVEN